jgi:hypothetical protein
MKFFNTAGPVNQAEHYKIAPLTRWDLEEILLLFEQEKYFTLHAPRQTGKTSCLLALRDYLNERDDYHCVYAHFEAGQTARNNIEKGIKAILSELNKRLSSILINCPFTVNEVIHEAGADNALNIYLTKVCKMLDRPLILLIGKLKFLPIQVRSTVIPSKYGECRVRS